MTASASKPKAQPSKWRKRYDDILEIPVSYYGYGFCRVWVILEALYYADVSFAGGAVSSKVLFNIAGAFVAFAIALYASRRFSLLGAKGLDTASALLCVVSALCFFASEAFAGSRDLLIACADIFGAVGLGLSSSMWIELYGKFNPTRTALYVSGSIVFGAIVLFVVQGFTSKPYMYGAFVFLPLAWLFCLKRAKSHARGIKVMPPSGNRARFPWKIALFLAVYALAYAMASSFSTFSTDMIVYPWRALSALPALIVFCSIVASARIFNYDTIYRIAFPLMVCGFLLFFIAPDIPSVVSSHLIRISYAAASLLAILVICSVAYRTGSSVVQLYASVDFCQRIFMVVGAMFTASGFYHDLALSGSPIIPVAVTVLIVVATLMLLSEKSLLAHWGVSSAHVRDAESYLNERVGDLAIERNLTQRETEILLLLAQNETADSIAETMFIAKGTAKAHIHHVYTKLDVHSKQELFAVLRVSENDRTSSASG